MLVFFNFGDFEFFAFFNSLIFCSAFYLTVRVLVPPCPATSADKNRVNHGFVLELDPATTLTEHHICRIAAFDLFLWLLFALLYAGKVCYAVGSVATFLKYTPKKITNKTIKCK